MEHNELGSAAKKRKTDTAIDRLSSLPDAILVNILRLLALRTAVSTSVLSTQWRNLWKQFTSIELNKNCGNNNFFAVSNNILFKLTSPEFNLVNLIIPLSDESRSQGSLTCFYYLDIWIPLLCNRSIKNFSISLDRPLPQTPMALIRLPSSLVKCQSLVSLKIGGGFRCPSINNTSVCFPNLKRLQMSLVLQDDQQQEFVANVLKGCPILDCLHLEEYGFIMNKAHPDKNKRRCLLISAHKLKTLVINFVTPELYDKVMIDTPVLDNFCLIDTSLVRYTFVDSLDTPKALVTAVLKFTWPNHRSNEDHFFYTPYLLKSISSRLKSLVILHSTLGSLADYLDHGPSVVLSNLNNFKVIGLESIHCDKLMKFLQNCCPNLHTIVLEMAPSTVGNSKALDCQPAACLLTKVKVIKIHKLGPSKDELELVKYLQRNARVLNVLNLVVGAAKADYTEVQKGEQLRKEHEFCEALYKGSDGNFGCQISFKGRYFVVEGTQGEIGKFACGNLGCRSL